jgi:hypothetical protein
VGPTAPEIIGQLANELGLGVRVPAAPQKPGEVLLWRHSDSTCRLVRIKPPSGEHRRHTRKYAEGQLSPERSFYFRGPQKKLKLRAQNLIQFLELAEGVDEETWAYHFANGDYSRWFRDGIKDADLASEAEGLESSHSPDRADSLAPLRDAIERRYTLPAAPPVPVRGAE